MVIYCDMDGVLANYDKAFQQVFDGDIPSHVFPLLGEEGVNEIINSVDNFWFNMEPMEDYRILWDFIKQYDPILLTTPAISVKNCKRDKTNWKNEYIGKEVTIIFSSSKQDYASPEAILIDDNKENIEKFIRKGGLGILHTSAEETIKQLLFILNDLLDDKILAKTKYFTIKQKPSGEEYNDIQRKSAVCLPIRIIGNNSEVLIRKEVNSIRGEFYTLVGGGIENNETEEQGILRELREEAGLVATEEQLFPAGYLVNDKYTLNKVALFFVLFDNTSKETPETDGTINESLAVNFWVSTKELDSLIVSLDDSFLLSALFKFMHTCKNIGGL